MKLNPDCVRDILLLVEKKVDFGMFLELNVSSPHKDLSSYSHPEILYHISQCEKAGLIDSASYYDDGDGVDVGDLSPLGHQLLADIRSDTVWSKTKTVSKKVGSTSLNALVQIATGVVTQIIKNELMT